MNINTNITEDEVLAQKQLQLEVEIEADQEIAADKIMKARAEGLRVIHINPQSVIPTHVINFCTCVIKSGERILITLPKTYTHLGGSVINSDVIAELTELYLTSENNSAFDEDVFIALRPKDDMIVCDMYHV